jgi:hypothetical protein
MITRIAATASIGLPETAIRQQNAFGPFGGKKSTSVQWHAGFVPIKLITVAGIERAAKRIPRFGPG